MFAILSALPVIGKLIDSVGGLWLKSRQQNIDAQTSHEARVQVVAEKEVLLDQREAELNAETRNIEADRGSFWQSGPRPAMGWIVTVFVGKVLLWDKAFGEWTGGRTDALDANLWWVCTTIIVSYFGGRTVERSTKYITDIWKKPK